jgi:hypothetical protein
MNSRFASIGLCLTLALGLAAPAQAAPRIDGVSGTVSNGEVVQVSGAGFGTRSDFNDGNVQWKGHRFMAFRFKDFDDQSLTSGGFSVSNSGAWMIRAGGRSGTGYMGTKFHNGQRLGALEARQNRTTGIVYSSFWILLPPGTATDSSKFWRIYGDASQANIYLENYGGGGSWSIKGYSECGDPSCSTATVWGSPDDIKPNTWHRIETLLERDNNGRFTVWMDSKLQWSRDRWVSASFTGDGHTIDVGNLLSSGANNSPDSNSFNYDEVYYDLTRARVEIGDASVWDQCKRREIQPPVSWSDSSLSVAVNQGGFAAASKAYLYVVGPDGSVNTNGYPVKFGDAGLSRPNPPVVQVQ